MKTTYTKANISKYQLIILFGIDFGFGIDINNYTQEDILLLEQHVNNNYSKQYIIDLTLCPVI